MSLLTTRATIKRRKPAFIRQDAHKKNETKATGWRRPRGLHSKMREGRRGYRIKISVGWKSPAAVRGAHPSGLMPLLIHRPADLAAITTTHGAVIASGVGDKKRLEILKAAQGKGTITILNVKDIAGEIAAISARASERKQSSQKRSARKGKPTEAPRLEKKVEQKTKEEEKKEHDKILTHPEK